MQTLFCPSLKTALHSSRFSLSDRPDAFWQKLRDVGGRGMEARETLTMDLRGEVLTKGVETSTGGWWHWYWWERKRHQGGWMPHLKGAKALTSHVQRSRAHLASNPGPYYFDLLDLREKGLGKLPTSLEVVRSMDRFDCSFHRFSFQPSLACPATRWVEVGGWVGGGGGSTPGLAIDGCIATWHSKIIMSFLQSFLDSTYTQ